MTAKRPSFAVDPHIRSRAISAIMMIGMASAVLVALSPLLRDDPSSHGGAPTARENTDSKSNESISSSQSAEEKIKRLSFDATGTQAPKLKIPDGIDDPGRASIIGAIGAPTTPYGDSLVPEIDAHTKPFPEPMMAEPLAEPLADPPELVDVPGAIGDAVVNSDERGDSEGHVDSDGTDGSDETLVNDAAPPVVPNINIPKTDFEQAAEKLLNGLAAEEPAAVDVLNESPTAPIEATLTDSQWTPPTPPTPANDIDNNTWKPSQEAKLLSPPTPNADRLTMSTPSATNRLTIREALAPGLPAPLLDFNSQQPLQIGQQQAVQAPASTPTAEAPEEAPAPSPNGDAPPAQGSEIAPPPAPMPVLPVPPSSAPSTPSPRKGNGPIVPADPLASVEVADNGEVTLHLDNVDIRRVLEMFSRSHSMNILVAPGVTGNVTANFEGVPVDTALNAVLDLCQLTARVQGRMLFVYPEADIPKSDLKLRVIDLDYANAEDLLPTVTSLLTPSGKAFASTVDENDNMKTKEAIVVTDVPASVARVESYISQVDHAPKQVLIEASVMEIELDHNQRHGVNYQHFLGDFQVGLAGMANPNATSAFFAQVSSSQVNALLECLRSTNHSKTLASPRVMVVNGQTARIQVGQQLGYKVVTATQAAAVEEVRFLEVGVVLQVTPKISRDNRVLMRVKPEVSNGEVNPDTELPEEETREVETDVLLANGQGLVIGGLIQEEDVNFEQTVPYIDKVPVIRHVFRKKTDTSRRSEIVITLIPKICDCPPGEVIIDSEEIPVASSTVVQPVRSKPAVLQTMPRTIATPRIQPTVSRTGFQPRVRR